MPLDPLPERHWCIEGEAVETFAAPTEPSSDQNSQALSVRPEALRVHLNQVKGRGLSGSNYL